MTEVRLTWDERKMLEVWLPHESELGEEQTDARSLVATWQTLEAADIADRLAKVRRHLGELRTERSLLDAPAPVGRGQPVDAHIDDRFRLGMAWLSPWEVAWLTVDRLSSREQWLAIEPGVLGAELGTTVLDGAAIAILCLDSASAGRQLAQTLAGDPACSDAERAWLAWLGGDDKIAFAEQLEDDLVGESPERSLAAALHGDWHEAEKRLPKALRKLQLHAIRPSGTRMHGQWLAQLAAHVLRGTPSREVIDQSLAVLFHHYGAGAQDPWWSGCDVQTRLPLLALYRRELQPETSACELLHAQRRHIEHIVAPPPRTYVAPAEVIAALAKLESVLASALAQGRGVDVELGPPENVYTIV